jgi:hypothetical protein
VAIHSAWDAVTYRLSSKTRQANVNGAIASFICPYDLRVLNV